ncbi:helicase-like protein [Anaerospora hongkongensis]|uniref:Helicase-like protein n=1 Tax=Anaerospora hongkongensis TaxID=244830 RepID=A0A4V2Q934_9FIRM|nr:DEAD/DEAH box helicase [Anaerospora hongkongensis]TCL39993.1 helicase-like protein [Anaerospora hongkongensis]
MNVPAYLSAPGEADYYYGTLSWDEGKKDWVIEGEPCVIEMAQRLFPGCKSLNRTKARFMLNKRTNGDLNWLMLRYPLRIKDQEQWNKTHQETVAHVLKRQEINARPNKIVPPPTFTGVLREFQQEGTAFLLHNRRTLLADDMGLGKTPQALAFLAAAEGWPALIVVVPHMIKGWIHESDKFLDLPVSVGDNTELFKNGKIPSYIHVIKGLKPYPLPDAKIYIIHYLLLRGWKNYLPQVGFKSVVFDEIQELRHRLTEKYSAASLVACSAENVIGLSGTPIHGRGGEMWNVMNIIDFHCLSDWESFSRTWCYGYGSDVVVDPELLGEHLKREGLLLRRTKEVLKDELLPKRRVIQPIDLDQGVFGDLIQKAIEKAKGYDAIEDYLERGRLGREIVNDTRMATGISKAGHVCAFVKMLLDAGEKVLLFGYHHAVFDIYMKELKEYKPVKITGKETGQEKDKAIETFMDGSTSLACISLRTAAGLNGLQSATCVVFGELDWSPAVHAQCEDRAHRIGQENSVLVYYLVCEEGSDENIQESLGLKVSQFVGLMGDKAETNDDRAVAQNVATDHMKKVIDKIKAMKPGKKRVV